MAMVDFAVLAVKVLFFIWAAQLIWIGSKLLGGPGGEGFAIHSDIGNTIEEDPLKRFDRVSEASEPPSIGIVLPLGRGGTTMKALIVSIAAVALIAASSPLFAQGYGRPQDGFSSQQYSGRYDGQVSLQYIGRVDGRGSRHEGLPPSAADKYNRTYENPISASDCVEVDSFAPSARPGWQARIRNACQ
jgi:hypothetical protein